MPNTSMASTNGQANHKSGISYNWSQCDDGELDCNDNILDLEVIYWILHVQLLTKTALQTPFRSFFLILSFSRQVLAFFFFFN